ncbi:MCE family protein [Mycobacterium sp. NPDC003449]
METIRRDGEGIPLAWWTVILLALIALVVYVTLALFGGVYRSYASVTLTSDRAGLVMESGGKVKMRGVEVGRVEAVESRNDSANLKLQINSSELKFIPANVAAQIKATTAFGAKYVELIPPEQPTSARLKSGAVLVSENVSTEVNTVFQNLTDLLKVIDPAKLNSILSAFAEGLRGQGNAIGTAMTDANQVLHELNPRADVFRQDWRSLKGFSDTYFGAADDLVKVLDAASTTSETLTSNAEALDQLLLSTIGLSDAGVNAVGPAKDDLVTGINALEPTTSLLLKYNPIYTCTLTGAKLLLDTGFYDMTGSNGRTLTTDSAVLMGNDMYKYPENLPIVGAKGGPGGQPGCGSLPDVSKNFPLRYLVANTGWGTGLDMRPNPGIGSPCYVDYLPATRGVPESISLRQCLPGPAPGPTPYPGAPPYGAQLYARDGTPLYPGLPPAPPPGRPRDGGPTPGAEPYVVPHPMEQQPTPVQPPPPAPASP